MKEGMANRRGTVGRTAAALVAAGLVSAALVVLRAQASPAPDLPAIAPDRLVASVLQALVDRPPISGKVDAFLDLGLPSLPDSGFGSEISSAAGLLAQINGPHHLRVWRSADGLRITDILPRSERALFVSQTEAWAWDFGAFTAYRLPFSGSARHDNTPGEAAGMLEPLELARRALLAASPSTSITVAGTGRVAGRPAYVLAVDPRSQTTLVRRVEIDVDAERRLPLRTAVFVRDRTSAPLWTAFTSVSFAPIDPDVYRFNAPPGARVVTAGGGQGESPSTEEYGRPDGLRHFGAGWGSVVAVRVPNRQEMTAEAGGLDLTSFLPLSGPVLSVRLVERADHAWLVYGLVPQQALAAVEPELP
jgi:hypothetical protein